MKKLRLALISLTVPAVTLLGLREIGGTPVSKGYDTGFVAEWDQSQNQIKLATDADGNMTCWVRLKVPVGIHSFSAKISTGIPLRVDPDGVEGNDQWIAIVRDGRSRQEKFEWSSGATLSVIPSEQGSALPVKDWYIFVSDKQSDSKSRAMWRRRWFEISLGLLVLALVGGIFEAVDKMRAKRETFTPQLCLQLLISSVEGTTQDQSEQMRLVLQKVLFQGTPVKDALAPLHLNSVERYQLWFATSAQLRKKLEYLIGEITRYLSQL